MEISARDTVRPSPSNYPLLLSSHYDELREGSGSITDHNIIHHRQRALPSSPPLPSVMPSNTSHILIVTATLFTSVQRDVSWWLGASPVEKACLPLSTCLRMSQFPFRHGTNKVTLSGTRGRHAVAWRGQIEFTSLRRRWPGRILPNLALNRTQVERRPHLNVWKFSNWKSFPNSGALVSVR